MTPELRAEVISEVALKQDEALLRSCAYDQICNAINQAIEECAKLASSVTLDPRHRFAIHPDIPFEEFNEKAKASAHSTAQAIAGLIREKLEAPYKTDKR